MGESSTFTELKHQVSGSDVVLDIGTKDARKVSDLPGTVVAIDANEIKLTGSGEVEPVLGDGRQLPFRNDVFDYVFCTQVLEHVSGTGRLVSEASRVLDADGTAYFSFPNRLSWKQPHSLVPRYYSILPRSIGSLLADRVLDKRSAEYYERAIHPLSPLGARMHFHGNFRSVSFPMRLAPESVTSSNLLQTVIWWLNTVAMLPPLRWIGEFVWPNLQYVCGNPKEGSFGQ